MRVYEVRPGDSPASIASRPEMAGCPKCANLLIQANPHKATVTHPNGFVTFRELRAGEKLWLPDAWFDGTLDAKPKSYFRSLPSPDGVTLPKSGALGDQTTLDAAAAKVGVLSALTDQPFNAAANPTADAIDASVQEIPTSATYAAPYVQDVRKSTARARQRNADLATAISSGDTATAFQARIDILHDFSDALASAGLALQAFPQAPANITAAAQAAAAAITADPNFCESISRPGSATNSAVHAFKTAWNAANPSNPVPINTGTYEQATADVLTSVLGKAPAACGARGSSPSLPGGGQVVTPPQEDQGLSIGSILGFGLLGAGAVGGAYYLFTQHQKPPKQARPRIRRVPQGPERHDTIGPWSPPRD